MSRSTVRSGTPVQPPSTTTGTPGASDEVLTFVNNTFARPCFVTNTSATDDLFVLPNEDGCSATNFLVKLAPLQAVDLSVEGQMCITSVSLYYAVAAYSAALVRGWVV